MLLYINPEAAMPETIAVVARDGCPHCARARKMLEERGYSYEEIQVGRDISQHSLRGLTGSGSVPQIFINGKLVGGADDLQNYISAH
jgi:glutaredoxin-like protein